MAETRVQIAYHFKVDPAQLTPGAVRLPEMITRTVSVGDDFTTEKVALISLPPADRRTIAEELDKKVREATRTARAAGDSQGDDLSPESQDDKEEMSAF